MPTIQILPGHVANQIAAGEVVERPASVVKELLENALDAGARSVAVEAEAGGVRRIRLVDDGHGMTREDAQLALQRHSTSKLRSAADLLTIATLGFRGEALPSIAAVSRLTLETAPPTGPGTRIRVAGGRIEEAVPAGLPPGTAVTAEQLFYNVPARRKFLKTEATELGHIATLVSHYALAHPELRFSLRTPRREIFDLPPAAGHRERLRQLFGAAAIDPLLEAAAACPLPPPAASEAALAIYGFISPPEIHKLNRESVFTFVNRRLVHDRVILHALAEAYRNLLPNGVHPMVLLFLDLPFAEVDVNVHPAKTEVRFRRQAWIHDAVRDAIRQTLGLARPMPSLPHQVQARPSAAALGGLASLEQGRQEATAVAFPPARPGRSGLGQQSSPAVAAPGAATQPIAERWQTLSPAFRLTPLIPPPQPLSLPLAAAPELAAGSPPAPHASGCSQHGLGGDAWLETNFPSSGTDGPWGEQGEEISGLEPLGQIRASFIVAAGPHGLWLVDQHAAHERVLFEQLLDQIAGASDHGRQPPSQRLLLPAIVSLPPAQWLRFDEIEPQLRAAGFDIEPFGHGTFAIKAAPAGLPPDRVEGFWAELIETDQAEWRRASLDRRLGRLAATLACHAAIKVNTPLEPDKILWLLQRLAATRFPMTCPHGRPALLHYSLRDIQRAFKR